MIAHQLSILDCGMGRQLARMGAPFRLPEGSALALIEAPDFVSRAHAAYGGGASAGQDRLPWACCNCTESKL